MIVRLATALSLAMLAVTAAPAAHLSETHVEARMPPAKGLLPVYRPIAKAACAQLATPAAPPGKVALVVNRAKCAAPRG